MREAARLGRYRDRESAPRRSGFVDPSVVNEHIAAGCARREPVPDAAALQTRSQALIEAGNTFYRAGDHTTAAKRYGAAVAVKPDDPAARDSAIAAWRQWRASQGK